MMFYKSIHSSLFVDQMNNSLWLYELYSVGVELTKLAFSSKELVIKWDFVS